MNKNYQYILRLFFLVIVALFLQNLNAQINFTYQSGYNYLKGSEASTLPSDWMNEVYADTGWTSGNAPFHYGDGFGGTELSNIDTTYSMRYYYSTIYLRSTFNVSNLELLTQVIFSMDYDDGFVVWINGEIALQQNAPAVLAYNAFAPLNHESGSAEVYTLNAADLNLTEGVNTIAVQGFNVTLESSDFYFDMQIEAETSTPVLLDTVGISFSNNSGFYSSAFNLTMTSPDPSANLVYTIDGSNPQSSTTAITTGSTITLSINPASSVGRAVTPGYLVRASIKKGALKPSIPETRTFIFLENVKTQSADPGGGWPTTSVNGQTIDLEVDADIINDSRYTSLIEGSMKDIPSLSVVTDLENLFDPTTGIYVNAMGHGVDWERECSFELIDPKGIESFNVNAGIRIRGGYSRNSFMPKHAFRLFFRSEYGDSKLKYPLFGSEGVSEFDKIDLRTEQNYAWCNGDSRNSLVREIFSRDTQRDMGQPYTRSRYYHLYINGMYWGMYQTQERSEARFAADYLGGKSEDYDVIKVATDKGYQIEATDGNLSDWQKIWNMCTVGFTNNANYFKIEGKGENGKPNSGIPKLVDIDNLIDYMLVIFYTGNFDAPVSTFGNNKMPNNFYAIRNRNDILNGYKFFAHDSEHTLFADEVSPGWGLTEDRVNLATRTGAEMEVSAFSGFHPQWLHYKLCSNAEYRLRFADRAYKALQGDGVLTPAKARIRVDEQVAEIEDAVIGESARWGDGGGWGPLNKIDNWLPEINKIRNDFLPVRTNILINQLKVADLYPSVNPPIVKKSGTIINSASYVVSGSISVSITNPNTVGTMYYTLDGTDPRIVDGAVSSSAIVQSADFTMDIITTTILKTRVYDGTEWSPLKRIDFLAAVEDYTNLKVTELNYHPKDLIVGIDTTFGQDFEFIEFKNIGTSSINLANLVIDSAIYYEFPADAVLGPNQFWVVASKPSKFYDYFGLVASGNFSSNFSNGGEKILLRTTSGTKVIEFVYDDASPWPERPDGDGFTLVSSIYNPTGDPNDPYYWRSSILVDGSPFKDDDGIPWGVESPVDLTSDLVLYPNPASEFVHINFKDFDAFEPLQIKMYNLNGSLVYQNVIENNSSIDLGTIGLNSGLFIVHITSENLTQTVKLIYSPQ